MKKLNTQICKLCNTKKPFDEFSRHGRYKTGFKSTCKLCLNEIARNKRQLAALSEKENPPEYNKNDRPELQSHVGKHFGSYKIIEYLGSIYINGSKRYRLIKECRFCKHQTTIYLSGIKKMEKNRESFCMACRETIKIDENLKKCSCCQKWLPATYEFFGKSHERKFGLDYYCRSCKQKKRKKARQADTYLPNARRYIQQRRDTDHIFKLGMNTRALIRNNLKTKFNHQKNTKTEKMLTIPISQFAEYIEAQFEPFMTWDNYGEEWHLEHIVSLGLADTVDEIYNLNNYINYKPLGKTENLTLGKRIVEDWITPEIKNKYSIIIERNLHVVISLKEFQHELQFKVRNIPKKPSTP